MSKMQKDSEVRSNDPRHHADDRLCTTELAKGIQESPRFIKIVAVCTCGRTKEYYATESVRCIFVCNGGVILKYREDGFFGHPFPRLVAGADKGAK
jgi:hypothetical protein